MGKEAAGLVNSAPPKMANTMTKLPDFEDRYYTTAEASSYLGLHPKTIRKMCLRGELRYDRVGRNGRWLRIKRSWLDEFAQRWRVESGERS